MSIRDILSETEMVKNTILSSLTQKLMEFEEEVSDYELRRIIFSMFKRILGYHIEWADPDVHGKNRILIQAKEKEIVVNITGLMDSIRKIHREYIEKIDKELMSSIEEMKEKF
jgi:hypothetical protein